MTFSRDTPAKVIYEEIKREATGEAEYLFKTVAEKRNFVINEISGWGWDILKLMFADKELSMSEEEKTKVIKHLAQKLRGEGLVDSLEEGKEWALNELMS